MPEKDAGIKRDSRGATTGRLHSHTNVKKNESTTEKTLTVLTLALIICMTIIPVTVEAKKPKETPKEQVKHNSKDSSKPIPRNGFIVKKNLGNQVTLYREYIPLNIEELAESYPIDPSMIEQLPDGLYYSVNVYAYETKDSVILIDAGHELLAKKLYAEIKSENKRKPITVLLTHGHADHAGGGSYLQKHGATIYVHSYDQQMVLDGYESPLAPDAFKYTGYQATPYPSEFIDGFSIIPTPGHTMGSVSILYQKTGMLFTGDLTITMFEETSQNDFTSELVLYTLLSRPSELLEIQESSLNYLNSSLQTYSGIYPGHNGPYKG